MLYLVQIKFYKNEEDASEIPEDYSFMENFVIDTDIPRIVDETTMNYCTRVSNTTKMFPQYSIEQLSDKNRLYFIG